MRSSDAHAKDSSEGFIVVAVLWIIGALATLASIYAAYVINTTAAFAVNDDRIKAEAAISASLELVAYELSGGKQEALPTQGAFRFRLGHANIAVSFISEGARIDLNKAPKELLAGLFAALGTPDDAAKDYADRIIAWRRPPQSGTESKERSLYRAAGLDYGPRGAPFASIDELWLVHGLPRRLIIQAMPYLTVFSGKAEVDVRDAPPEVLLALPGMTPKRVDAVLQQRELAPKDDKSLLALLGPAQTAVTKTKSNAMRVTSHIHFDNGRQVNAEAVIAVVAGGNTAYRVLSWHDDLDGPLPIDHARVARR
jgi:general secretion pathway protein K